MASDSKRTSLARSRLLYRGSCHLETFCSVLLRVILGAACLSPSSRLLHVTYPPSPYSKILTMPKPSKKISSKPDAKPAEPVTLNEALVSEYPDDFVVQYVFAPAAKTPRRMLRYKLRIRSRSSRCELTRRQSHTCNWHRYHRVSPDL